MQLPPLALLYPVCRSQLCVLRGMDDPHGALFIENMIYKENTTNTQLSSDPSSEATGKRGGTGHKAGAGVPADLRTSALPFTSLID